MFQDARLTLTLWYIAIIMAISLAFSTVIFVMVNREVVRLGVQRKQSLEKHLKDAKFPAQIEKRIRDLSFENDTEVINDTKKRILIALIEVNIFILVVAGGLSYFLAGKTLQPIKVMVEEQHRFIGDASHELKTPLTALRTIAEVALRDKTLNLKEARATIISTINYASQLQVLTDRLLRSNAGQESDLEFVPVDLSLVVTQAVASVASLASVKKIAIKKKLEPSVVMGNVDQLKELFVVLLDNAIKYSQSKKVVTVTSSIYKKKVCIAVIDQGVGMSSELLPKIFDRFYRASSARTKSATTNGYGLGLSIAKQITRDHCGTLSVTSQPSSGSCFTVCLPRVR